MERRLIVGDPLNVGELRIRSEGPTEMAACGRPARQIRVSCERLAGTAGSFHGVGPPQCR